MNIRVYVSIQIMVFFWYMLKSGIAGLYSNFIFSFLRSLHTVFHSSFTNLHFHQEWRRVPCSPYILRNLLFAHFFADGHSERLPLYLKEVPSISLCLGITSSLCMYYPYKLFRCVICLFLKTIFICISAYFIVIPITH